MARALNKLAAFEFVPLEDRELAPEEQTRFTLRPLNGVQRLEAFEAVQGGNTWRAMTIAVRHGLRAWSNFKNDDGPVEFSDNMAENIAALSMGLIVELSKAINDASQLAEGEKKT